MTFDLLIRHARILQLAGPRTAVIENGCIGVQGPRITWLGPAADLPDAKARETIDARGQLAMPGLVNTHAHSAMVLFRGLAEDLPIEQWFNEVIWPLEGRLSPEDVYWGALLALVEMIEGGVTTVADHYFFMDAVARAVEQAGTRAELGWTYFSSQGPQGVRQGVEFTERWQGGADGRIRTWLAPHAPYTCDDATLRQTAGLAEQLGVGVHIHAAENMQQTTASLGQRGLSPIQVLERTGILAQRTLIAHGCGLLPADVDLLAGSAAVGVAHAPATYLRLAMGLTPLQALTAAGVPVGLASDGVPSNANADLFEAMRLTAMLQKHVRGDARAVPVAEALSLATAGGASALGRPDELGHLAVGALADLILVDLSGAQHQPLHNVPASLVYNTRPENVRSVIVNGRPVMLERALLTLDKEHILREAGSRARRLLGGAGLPVQTYAP